MILIRSRGYKVSRILGRVPPDLRFRGPLRRNPSSGALKSTLPGHREGSSILNSHLVVMSAAVCRGVHSRVLNSASGATCGVESWGGGGGGVKPSVLFTRTPPGYNSAGPVLLRTNARTCRRLRMVAFQKPLRDPLRRAP